MTPSDHLSDSRPDSPSLGLALLPITALVGLLGLSYLLYGDRAAGGPNQIALIACALIAYWVGRRLGHSPDSLRQAAVESVNTGLPAIFILLAVGSLIGTWAMSGTLIAMVYWGLQLMQPDYFYLTTAGVCAIVALCIGSSWTVAGTIGIGLMGVAVQMGLDPAITAGAVISGSYFGDKSSPLSDATNLAAAAAGSNLYDHIRETLWTSVPTLLIALTLFWLLGKPGDFDATQLTAGIAANFDVSFLPFIPLLVVLALAFLRWPPFVTIFLGAVAGGVLAVFTQPQQVIAFAGAGDLPDGLALLKGVWSAMATGYESSTGMAAVDELLSRGGMASMLGTIWLILAALAFGGVIEKAGVLDRIIQPVIRAARSVTSLVASLVAACIGTNILASDQYIAIVLPGRMFQKAFRARGLAPVVLSRAVGDSATVTSALIPWNSCGAYMAATLGVTTVTYLPFAFFNLLNPVVTILAAAFGFRMLKVAATAPDAVPTAPPRPTSPGP